MAKYKTIDDRKDIVKNIIKQFHDLGIDIEVFEPLQKLNKILTEYQANSITSGFSGKFYVPELNRHVEYVLPLRKLTNGYVKLIA